MKENYIRTLREGLRRVQEWQPLTVRGLLCLVASAWSLYAFAIPESDLIAFITGGSILGLSVLCILAALFLRLRLRKRLQVQAFFSPGENIVGTEIASGIVLTGAELPPFFTLHIKRILDHPGIISRIHVVAGAESRKNLIDSVAFPHRGVWNLMGFDFALHDALGLSSIRWRVPHSAPVEVSARVLPIQPLPIMAASSRSGDQLNHSQERSGDLFDIKAYDPSDGITRVLWKTYARSGQLVVRRPEPAVVPEGEVAIYVVARKNEDYVVGAFLSYLEELERGNITVIFGTDGLRDATGIASDVTGGLVTNPATIRTALNRTFWQKDTG